MSLAKPCFSDTAARSCTSPGQMHNNSAELVIHEVLTRFECAAAGLVAS